MLVIMKEQAAAADLQRIVDRVEGAGGTAECHKPYETVIVVNGCPPSLEDEIRGPAGCRLGSSQDDRPLAGLP